MQKRKCPECGVRMNPHATRIFEARTAEEERLVDPALGGVVVERHTCPECGGSRSHRPAEGP